MNVSNFFKFIGEKRPEYEYSAENTKLIGILKNGYKDMVQNGTEEYEDVKEFLPLPIKDKGYVDANGKQGLFLIVQGSFEAEPIYDHDRGGTDYNFDFVKLYTNYKNDLKDGIEKLYLRYNTNTPRMTTEYKEGKKNGKQIYYDRMGNGLIVKVNHYVNDRLIQDDLFYDNGKISSSSFHKAVHTKAGTVFDTTDLDKPRIYYSYETGEPIDYKTYRDQGYFTKVRKQY